MGLPVPVIINSIVLKVQTKRNENERGHKPLIEVNHLTRQFELLTLLHRSFCCNTSTTTMTEDIQPLSTENLSIHNILSSSSNDNDNRVLGHTLDLLQQQQQGHDGEEEEEDERDAETEYTYETDLVNPHDIQKEWEKNLAQLITLVNFVLIPVVGKIIGRKCAHLVWDRLANRIW